MHTWIIVVATYIAVENFSYAALQLWLLRRRQSAAVWLERGVIFWACLMTGLLLLQMLEPLAWKSFMRDWLYLPMAVEMVWNVLLLQVLFPAMILVVLLVRLFSRRRNSRAIQPVPLSPDEISRRKFLYLVSYGAAPSVAIAMGVHGSLTRHELRVRKFDIPIANLPPELEGFTIAHVSDLHSGLFVGPARLKVISDMTNDLKANLVVITGDIINREMGEFPAALAAIRRMESPYGTYLCEGNHDAMPGPCALVATCEQNGLRMLFNRTTPIPVGNSRLLLGGLSWGRTFEMDAWPTMVRDFFPPRLGDDVRILLAHHPDLFDIAQDADLVLSGHTHGGQIMLGDNIGLGRLRFKYCSGRFQRGNTTMIVSNGCGDWFPCRIGAPAEIGLLRLTRA